MESNIKNDDSLVSSVSNSSGNNTSFKLTNLGNDSALSVQEPSSFSIRSEQLKQKSIAHDYKTNKHAFNKNRRILCKVTEEVKTKNNETIVEKTLLEIGFKANEIESWENMNQPPKKNLYKLLKHMIDNYIKPNVQIRIKDAVFNCHMMVLQCYSDFFMECSNEAIICLPGERITPKAFLMVYDWMLSEEPLIQREGILELFNAANFLKIEDLVDQCWVCLDDDIRFQEDTAFLLYLEARTYGLDMLQQLMLTRICKFFLTLVASKDFLMLSLKEVCSLLSSNSIGVNSEVEKLIKPKESRDQAIQATGYESELDEIENNAMSQTVDIKTSWYQEIYSSRRPHACGHFILENISNPTDKNSNKNKVTMEDNKNITLSQKSSSCCDVNQKAINIKKSILAKSYYCSLSSRALEYTTANSMRLKDDEDKDCQKMSLGRINVSTLKSVPKKEESVDGCSTSKATGVKQIDDSHSSRKQDTRSEFNLNINNQKIFIFGGIDPYAERHTNTSGRGMDVLYYDSCENAWRYLSNMPGSRHQHSAVVYRGKIYVVGGIRPALDGSIESIFETAVWSFDPKRLEWHDESNLPQPRRDFGLIAYDNPIFHHNDSTDSGQGDKRCQLSEGIYIIGGESIDGTPLLSTLYYDVNAKHWFEKASLNIGRYGLVAAVVSTNNTAEIWIAGGVNGKAKGGIPVITDTMESYDGSTWKKCIKRLRIPSAARNHLAINLLKCKNLPQKSLFIHSSHWVDTNGDFSLTFVKLIKLFAKFCTLNGGKDIYIIGGIGYDQNKNGEFMSLSSIDRYDDEGWIHHTDMIKSRHGHEAVPINEKILILGGVSSNEKKTLNSVECYSTKTHTWLYNIRFLPLPLSGLAAAVIDCD